MFMVLPEYQSKVLRPETEGSSQASCKMQGQDPGWLRVDEQESHRGLLITIQRGGATVKSLIFETFERKRAWPACHPQALIID
jgi:hypothetical protein